MVALLASSSTTANEVKCLAKILFAEARGGSLEHLAILGQAAVAKAAREHVTLCTLPGVKQVAPGELVRPYFETVAKELISHPKTTLSRGADHWDSHKKQIWPGKITRELEGHKFYILNAKPEKWN